MARRYEDVYERDGRDRRPRDLRDMQRELDSREPRDRRRQDGRESDRIDYPRDGRSDIWTTREPLSRPVYAYPDQMERDDVPSRPYLDDTRERHRPPIDLQSQRREEPSSRYQEYFLPGEDIHREVIQYDICRYLGNDATVRPYSHADGRQGYLIKAYRAPTTAMITTLKQDSKRFEQEQVQRRRQYGQPGSYEQSATFDERQRQGRPDVRPDVPQSGYAGYQMDTRMDGRMDTRMDGRMDNRMDNRMDTRIEARMDTTMDDYDGDDRRGAGRGYGNPEPRIDPRQQQPINRHPQIPSPSQGYQQESPFPPLYQALPVSTPYTPDSDPRTTLGPNTTPPLPMSRVGQTTYAGGFPITTTAGYTIPTTVAPASTTRYGDPANRGNPQGGYPGGGPYRY